VGHLGETAEHDDLLLLTAGDDGQDARPHRGHDRRMTRQHAEIALEAGNVDLVDLAGECELFGRDEIEVEGGHSEPANSEWRIARGEEAEQRKLFATPHSPFAS